MWMLFGSVATEIGKRNVAGFPAVRAIVKAVRAQTHSMLAFANRAVFLTGTALFRLVTHDTHYKRTGHGKPPHKTVPDVGNMRQGTHLGQAASYLPLSVHVLMQSCRVT